MVEATHFAQNPDRHLSAWIEVAPPDAVLLKTGKVELGQGILTALRQIAAEELDLPLYAITVISGDTAHSPFEGGTVGSMSLETSGPLIRQAAANLRQRLIEAAAMRSQLPGTALTTEAGRFYRDGVPIGDTFWTVADKVDFDAPLSELSTPKAPRDYRIVGTSPPQLGLTEKLTGAAYVHDIVLGGMLHGRILRKPHPPARLLDVDVEKIAAIPGVVQLVRERDLVGVVAVDEHRLAVAMERLERACRWDMPQPIDPSHSVQGILAQRPSIDMVLRDDTAPPTNGSELSATYTKPLIGHGSIGPSCGIALATADGISVWSHSQTVFALRDQIARVMQISADSVRVRHVQAAGCYGHNGADDAAMDAVMLASKVRGRPVRVQWTRKDELTAEPLGSPMSVRVAGTISDGRIAKWQLATRSGTHVQRPGWNGDVNLLAPAAANADWPLGKQMDLPLHNGGTKNAVALYDFPQHVTYEFVPDLPFRLSALRSLGAFANVFAIESFMDELAGLAGSDPVEFRLAHLSDARARTVIERVADMGRWKEPSEAGFGKGIGFARFKNTGTYCAVVALVEVEDEVRLRHLWAAVDAGLAINPKGIVAQIEGGMLQAASWTLKEEVPTDRGVLTAENWRNYPILTFAEIPDIAVDIISAPAHVSTGVGEVSLGPAAGAIGNAVANALGVRIRDLPLTRDRVVSAIMNS